MKNEGKHPEHFSLQKGDVSESSEDIYFSQAGDLKETSLQESDLNDRASSETDQFLELRTRDRMRKLIKKINAALDRIENGTYGYCEETGEPIGLGRLEARPVTTLSIEAQERHERKEKMQSDE